RCPQYAYRGFFAELDHPVLGPRRYPTVPYRLGATPARLRTAAPPLGAHTTAVLEEAAR
ncbi:MAG: CoA transferase, partial [Panacagrimonas sp.]